ncbi:MAG: hypothetical protein ACK5RV_01730 [Flavobacterium sp.]|jgi:hypothetical protein|uniref:hypothetical protein n=1 Tax=Flavobacterium sp. TaxID=239 RepID=UPI0022C62412|nr:hypothetical protein [Flavobacterium sp.]MCZ8167851.1 hypothetical protein [Flavobacterium sp.]MCZ8297640.1 hypothetical protein [Flavobacterium sp.]
MKKRLEAELISIAHRILKLRNKSEVDQLYTETRKLYETLAVLKFYGDHFEVVKNDVAVEDLEAKLDAALDIPEGMVEAAPVVEETPVVVEETPAVVEDEVEDVEEVEEVIKTEAVVEAETIEEEPVIVGEITLEEEEIEEDVPMTEAKSDLDFEPIFELAAEPMEETAALSEPELPTTPKEEPVVEAPKKDEPKQISFEELLGENYTEPIFVKPDDVVVPPSLKTVIDEQGKSLNELHSKSINIGLNDKIAFVKYLFADSTEDYNRVLSQLNTFSTFPEAKDFIDEIIKPDYNNWDGVDDYAERFIAIVAKKFS